MREIYQWLLVNISEKTGRLGFRKVGFNIFPAEVGNGCFPGPTLSKRTGAAADGEYYCTYSISDKTFANQKHREIGESDNLQKFSLNTHWKILNKMNLKFDLYQKIQHVQQKFFRKTILENFCWVELTVELTQLTQASQMKIFLPFL